MRMRNSDYHSNVITRMRGSGYHGNVIMSSSRDVILAPNSNEEEMMIHWLLSVLLSLLALMWFSGRRWLPAVLFSVTN